MSDPTQTTTDPAQTQPAEPSGIVSAAESVAGSLLPSNEKLNDLLEAAKAFLIHEADNLCEFGIARIKSFYSNHFHPKP